MPPTTILIIGDPHFQVGNVPAIELFISKITDLAKKLTPTFIVCLGDLLHDHEKLHTTPLNYMYEFVHAMRVIAPFYILVGNHDYINNQQYLTENHWMNAMKEWKNVTVVDSVVHTLTANQEHIIFMPYVPNGRFKEALISSDTNWTDASLIFAHQEFYGCDKGGGGLSVEGDNWDDEYPFVVSGHEHINQVVGRNIYYPGNSMQQNFGEAVKKIVASLTLPFSGNVSPSGKPDNIVEHDLKLPRKENIKVDIEDLDELKLPDISDGSQVKVTVTGSSDSFKTIKKTTGYKNLISQGVKVAFKPKKDSNKIKVKAESSDFNQILHQLINNERDGYLNQAYEKVVNSRDVEADDAIWL